MKGGVRKLKDYRKIQKVLLFAIAAAAVCLISVIGTDLPKEPEGENTVSENSAEYGHFYPRPLNNTVIRKADGSYWVCGENVGTEERVVTGEEADETVVCTHEFHRCG